MAKTQATDFADYVNTQLDEAKPDDGRERIDNRERGCGHLKQNKCYIRSDTSALSVPGGEIPKFVELDDPVEYREDLPLRGYGHFPGTNFSLAYTADDRTTTPPGDIHDHVNRMQRYGLQGDHYHNMPAARSTDLIMSVGETYYPDPDDFIAEARERGLNKAIPVSKNNDPPEINPLRTRVWIIHPNACGGSGGIIGYSYLTRIIYTSGHAPGETGDDPEVPGYVEDWAETGHVDIVDRGDAITDDEDDDPDTTLADFTTDPNRLSHEDDDGTLADAFEDTGASDYPDDPDYKAFGGDVSVSDDTESDAVDPDNNTVIDNGCVAVELAPSDKDGRDVEEAPTDATSTPDDEADQSDDATPDDLRDALRDEYGGQSYNQARSLGADHDIDLGATSDMTTLLQALVDAGVTPADVRGDDE